MTTNDTQKLEPVDVPEWMTVYNKLATQLKSIPFDSNGIRQGFFAPQSGPLTAESVRVSQDSLGFMAVVGYMSHDLLFSAHPESGCRVFEKGDWLNILNKATP